MKFMARRRAPLLCAALPLLAACDPALNWRDVRPEGTAAQVQFPCRPAVQDRPLALEGRSVKQLLYACSAGGAAFGLGYADVGDPARVAPALAALQAAAAGRLGAAAGTPPLAFAVPGATPYAGSARLKLAGRTPDGAALQMQLAVFAHGTQVFQATVVGERVADEAAEAFFGSLRFAP